MFEDEEWNAILAKLADLTRANKTIWTHNEHQGLLTTSVGANAYAIGSVDMDDREPYFFAVLRMDDGTAVELARLESTHVGVSNGWSPGERIVDLQHLAFRMAKGGPQLASELLADMEKLLPSQPQTPWPGASDETPF